MKVEIWLILYNTFVVPIIYLGFYTGSLFSSKIREGLTARKHLFRSLKKEIDLIDKTRKRILFHCSSAGEWQQALPVIERIKTIDPGIFIMVSYFSPSGFKFARDPHSVDLKIYLPLDSYFAAIKFFKLTDPGLWIISATDVWPNHVIAASKLNIPIVITSAILSPESGRDKGLSKFFNRKIYSRISQFFPVSEDTLHRFLKLIPDADRFSVAGDTRYDHVYNRSRATEDAGDINVFQKNTGITIIAGSTWPADEKHLLPALGRLLLQYMDIRLIIVPHEIHENHLIDIENKFRQFELKTIRYTDRKAERISGIRVVIFNAVGMLARLYKQTDIAFVGGSFGKGTHNVMEPAVFGQPVLFGPNHLNSHESVELLKTGAAFRVTNETDIYEKIEYLVQNRDKRSEMGFKARNLIMQNIGATDLIISKLQDKYKIFS